MIENDEINELYQALVLDHSRKPKNFGTIECSCHTKGKNPSCGDEINLFVKAKNNIIEDIKFTGEGCALSIASTSLMTQNIKHKTLDEAQKTIDDFINFIVSETNLDDSYEPLHIFQGVKKFPLRVKCVLLGWRALEQNIKQTRSNNNGN